MKILSVINESVTEFDRFENYRFYRDADISRKQINLYRIDQNLNGLPAIPFNKKAEELLKSLKEGTTTEGFIKFVIKLLQNEASLLLSECLTIQNLKDVRGLSLTTGCKLLIDDIHVCLDIYVHSGKQGSSKGQFLCYDAMVDYRFPVPEGETFRTAKDISFLLQYHSGKKRMELVVNQFSNNGLFGFVDNSFYKLTNEGFVKTYSGS